MALTDLPPPRPDTAVAGPTPRLPEPRLPQPQPTHEPEEPRSRSATVVLVAVGLVALFMLLAAAALPVLRGSDDEPAAETPAPGPSTSLELRPQAAPAGGSDVAEEPTAEESVADEVVVDELVVEEVAEPTVEAPAVEEPAVEEPAVEVAPVVEEPATDEAVAADVPESKAVVRGGQIFLEGAVPTAEAGEEIARLAAEILGPDNVFNNYTVDPRASDPNLGNVTVEDTINFATGSAVLLPEAEGLLNQALALMTIRPSVTVIVVGHTDSRGSDEYNLELSVQRAEAVKTWLTDRGIDGARLTVVGKGESEPIATNDTAEGQRLNRRIQFFLENLLADS